METIMITVNDKGIIDLISSIEERPMQYFWLRTIDFSQQLYISDSFKHFWNRPIEELYASPTAFRDALVKDDENIVKSYHGRANSPHRETSNDTILSRLSTPLGEIHHLRDACFPLYDSYGHLLGMAGVGKVITASEWEYDIQGQVKEPHPVSSILQKLQEKHIQLQPTISADQITIPCKKSGNKYFVQTSLGEIALTKRELECAQFLLAGKTAKETAKYLNISPRTVEEYLENIRFKFNCRNKLEIVNILIIS